MYWLKTLQTYDFMIVSVITLTWTQVAKSQGWQAVFLSGIHRRACLSAFSSF